MLYDISSIRLRLRGWRAVFIARRQRAEQTAERQSHLEFVEIYEAEMQQLKARLHSRDLMPNQSDFPQAITHI